MSVPRGNALGGSSAPVEPVFARRVIDWQSRHGRHHLPWQDTRDAYRIWLSEIMLQQTQVSTVLPYFARFLGRFPHVAALAAAPLDDVLAEWSGLGYYSRARNLHRCAQAVVAEHGGRFPVDSVTLATLPGIGRSTAAAIAVFSRGERVAILDGNVKRVLARSLGFGQDLAQQEHQRALWSLAEDLLPAAQIEAYTQGLMDLGATCCTLRQPACDNCPLGGTCVARAQGEPTAYPIKSRRLKRHRLHNWLLWLMHVDRVWLVQRPATGVWAGLWSFAEFGDEIGLNHLTRAWPGELSHAPAITHVLTHRDWVLSPLVVRWPDRLSADQVRQLESTLPNGRWFTIEQAMALGLATPIRRWLNQVMPVLEIECENVA